MKTRSIAVFRAHYNVRLSALAEKLNMSVDELTNIDEVTPVPQNVAEKIVEAYDLVPFYFTEDIEYTNKVKPLKKTLANPFWYFFKITFIATIVVSFGTTIPYTLLSFVGSYFAGSSQLFSTIISGFLHILLAAFTIGECIFVSKYILSTTTLSGKIDKYKFLWYILPNAMILVPNVLIGLLTERFMLEGNDIILYILNLILSLFISLVSTALSAYIFVFAIEKNPKKQYKGMTLFSIISILSYVVYYIIRVAFIPFGDMQNWIASIITAVFAVLTITGLLLQNKLGKKADNLIYTVLPVLAIVGSDVFYVIFSIFNNI